MRPALALDLAAQVGTGVVEIHVYAYSNVSQAFNSTTADPVDVNSAPTVTLTGPASGTFAITARATDARGGVTDSSPRTLVITSPAQGTVLAAGQPFTVTATASDPDDAVQRAAHGPATRARR